MKVFPGWMRFLRFLAILMMGITALFTLASGLGTSCVAINPTGFGPNMAPLARLQWLYILFVVITTLIGLMGMRAVFLLIRGRKNAYPYTMTVLIAGLVIGVIHMATSRALRGKSMPVDAVVDVTAFTLILFLIFLLPRLRPMFINSEGESTGRGEDQIAAFTLWATGIFTLTLPHWMTTTHTWDGVNWAAAFPTLTLLAGVGQMGLGIYWLLRRWQVRVRLPLPRYQPKPSLRH